MVALPQKILFHCYNFNLAKIPRYSIFMILMSLVDAGAHDVSNVDEFLSLASSAIRGMLQISAPEH